MTSVASFATAGPCATPRRFTSQMEKMLRVCAAVLLPAKPFAWAAPPRGGLIAQRAWGYRQSRSGRISTTQLANAGPFLGRRFLPLGSPASAGLFRPHKTPEQLEARIY